MAGVFGGTESYVELDDLVGDEKSARATASIPESLPETTERADAPRQDASHWPLPARATGS